MPSLSEEAYYDLESKIKLLEWKLATLEDSIRSLADEIKGNRVEIKRLEDSIAKIIVQLLKSQLGLADEEIARFLKKGI